MCGTPITAYVNYTPRTPMGVSRHKAAPTTRQQSPRYLQFSNIIQLSSHDLPSEPQNFIRLRGSVILKHPVGNRPREPSAPSAARSSAVHVALETVWWLRNGSNRPFVCEFCLVATTTTAARPFFHRAGHRERIPFEWRMINRSRPERFICFDHREYVPVVFDKTGQRGRRGSLWSVGFFARETIPKALKFPGASSFATV